MYQLILVHDSMEKLTLIWIQEFFQVHGCSMDPNGDNDVSILIQISSLILKLHSSLYEVEYAHYLLLTTMLEDYF